MDELNDTPSPGDVKADDLADPMSGESRLKESFFVAGAFLTAVLAVGGGILVLSRDAGPLHAINAPRSIDAAVVMPAGPQASAVAQPSATPRQAPRANAGTIYRCEVYGKTVYADVPCSSRNIRPVDVFVNEGFEPTDRSTLMLRRSSSNEPAALASSNDPARAERCKWIEEAIRQNEETARLPQSGQMQDYVTQQKRKLLDEKHTLGC
jgi:hypothetical protein